MIMKFIIALISLTLISCSRSQSNKTREVANTLPQFDSELVIPYQKDPNKKSSYPSIAYHQKEQFKLFYLGVQHDNNLKSPTNKLVEKLFKDYEFDVLLIEPFSYSFGESPAFFLKESQEGMSETMISGGEMALASIKANEKNIPFFGGEIDQKETYQALKSKNYSDEDIVGYHLARTIPQWAKGKNESKDFLEVKAPKYILSKCKSFGIEQSACPNLDVLKNWYQAKTGKKLGPEVRPSDVAPNFQSPLFLHKISSDNDIIRNQFTLNVIEELLRKYKRVAVVYGGAHYTSLKDSIEASMGPAIEIVTSEK
jgi:hypothetical protein